MMIGRQYSSPLTSFSVLLILFVSWACVIQSENIFFPRRFVYRQDPQVLFQIRHDPEQIKPKKVTRSNMFGWFNMKNSIRFHLWSRDNPHLAHEVMVGDLESLSTSSFNPKRLTKFIIHGYQDNANEVNVGDWIVFMKDAYLQLADVNVFAVDYSFFATTPFYVMPIHELVGEKLKDMLQFLMEADDLDLDSVHVIGWSWGAQAAGAAGRQMKGRIGRITGLDPAGPSFKFVDNEFRLDKSDAQFVDVIHTNAGSRFVWGGFNGLRDAVGHVDIYPNGGERQTGCPAQHTLNVETFPMCPCENFDKFVRDECACPVKDFAFLGEHMSRKTRGIFQIITRARIPYGHGPRLNITLPNIPKDELRLAHRRVPKTVLKGQVNKSRFNNSPEGKAIITYKNWTLNVPCRSCYRVGTYPNEKVLRLSLLAYNKIREKEGKDGF